jgi:hypothetical protein
VDERSITFGASTCVRLKSLDDVFIATPGRSPRSRLRFAGVYLGGERLLHFQPNRKTADLNSSLTSRAARIYSLRRIFRRHHVLPR